VKINKWDLYFLAGMLWFGNIASKPASAGEAFEYPELSVVPRASERVLAEARHESPRRWTTFLPIQLSALTTLTTGAVLNSNESPSKDPEKYAALTGISVGGGWLALTTLLSVFDTPYENAARELASMEGKSVRDQLTRERFAEEVINRRARLAFRIRMLSIVTNFAASAYMVKNAEGSAIILPLTGFSAVMAFAPLLFGHHWEEVASEQADYKKRIYAPVASAGLIARDGQGNWVPGMQLQFRF
jgi:hypothetical protein